LCGTIVARYAVPLPQKEPDSFEFAFNSEDDHSAGPKGRGGHGWWSDVYGRKGAEG